VGFANEAEMEKFLNEVSQKSYTDLFNVRSRLDQGEWKSKAIRDIKENIFSKENKNPTNKNVMYIHIPFCATRCSYCPYYTTPYNSALVTDYLNALEKEIYKFKNTEYAKSTVFESLYFGGGTPSILSVENIKKITNTIFSNFNFAKNGEFSFESNPSTLTKDKILALKSSGMNRVSLGIQTYNDKLLRDMQCAHTSEKAKSVVNLLLENNFVVNTDMIFGLIGQTKEDFEKDLEIINSYSKPIQLTLFPLRINVNTPLGEELYNKEGITARDHNERLLKFDALAEKYLLNNNFIREESPVFYYKNGFLPHKYNSTETRVVGLGTNAGTLLDDGESCNTSDINEYISGINDNLYPAISGLPLTQQQAYERFILYRIIYMQRSLTNFHEVVQKRFLEHFGVELDDRLYYKVIDNMRRLRFIEKGTDKLILTDRLWSILNKVKIGMPSIL
jgi:oxygen-independent coproporphyrinogen-3 oxidase